MPNPCKPQPDLNGRISYHHAIAYLEAKFGFDSRDYWGSGHHYAAWCERNGKPEIRDSVEQEQRRFKEYCSAPDGNSVCPPYEDFWHWLRDLTRLTPSPELPDFFRLDIPDVLATYDQLVAPQLGEVQERQRQLWQALKDGSHPSAQLIPEELREMTLRMYAPKDTTLRPFVRTILGYFKTEFGDVVVLDLRGA